MTLAKVFVAASLITLTALFGCSGSDEDVASNEPQGPQGPHTCTETTCGENQECVVISQSVCGVPCGGVRDPSAICGENFSCSSFNGEEATCTPRPPMTAECNDLIGCLDACDGEIGDTNPCVDDCSSTHITTTAVSDALAAWLSCGGDEFQCSTEIEALETACQMPGDWCEDPKACAQICDTASADATQCPEGTQCAESGHCI